jgi:hypothetical protein
LIFIFLSPIPQAFEGYSFNEGSGYRLSPIKSGVVLGRCDRLTATNCDCTVFKVFCLPQSCPLFDFLKQFRVPNGDRHQTVANIKPKLESKKITHTGLAEVNNRQHTLQYPPRMTNTIVTNTYQKIPTQRTNMHRHLQTRTNSHKLHHHRRNTNIVTNSTNIIVATPTSTQTPPSSSSQHKGITNTTQPPPQTNAERSVRSHGHHGRQTGEPRKDENTFQP